MVAGSMPPGPGRSRSKGAPGSRTAPRPRRGSEGMVGRSRGAPGRLLLGLAALIGLCGPALAARAQGAGDAETRPEADPVDALNVGLPPAEDPPDLSTPRTSLENFYDATDAGDDLRAARSLNLNAIPPARQAEEGRRLARQLRFVLDQKIWFAWRDIPERADGQTHDLSFREQQVKQVEGPRRYVYLGEIGVGDRSVTVLLHRLREPGRDPVWVFSRQCVEKVPVMYRAFEPSDLERRLPAALRDRHFQHVALWQWIGLGLFLAIGVGVGWCLQRLFAWALRRGPSIWATALAASLQGPFAFTLAVLLFYLLTSRYLRLAGPIIQFLEPTVTILITLGITWLLSRAVGCLSERLTQRYAARDFSEKQETLTRVKVGRLFLTFVIGVGGLTLALQQFEWFRMLGMTLLASAGVVGLILGVAAQRSLGNIFAGFQLALTQPVRVDDAVIFEGEFGWIEEVAITYVVIRTWDLRRLVVPTAYFIDKPLENWSRISGVKMKPVLVHADYRVPVDAVRRALGEILDDHPDYDESVPPILQVTACGETTVELRALCSAADPTSAWNLHCDVRERLVGFLRDLEGGRYLPRRRLLVQRDPGRDREGRDRAADGPRSARRPGGGVASEGR